MEKGYLVTRIKEIISTGKTLEACNHIELVLRKNSSKYDEYVVIKNELKRALNENLLGIITSDEKLYRLNKSNHSLVNFLSSLSDSDFHESINPTKSDKEILDDLLEQNAKIQFTSRQKEVIYEERIREKANQIKTLIKSHRTETLSLKNDLLESNNKCLELEAKLESVNKERARLKQIISEEYAKKKVWK